MTETEFTAPKQELAAIRAELVAAVAADVRRAPVRRRRRTFRLGIAAAVLAAATVGSAIAAVNGAFSPAPPGVQRHFAHMKGADVDVSHAVRIGMIDEHPAYAAPTSDGGYCLYFGPAQRSGPSGGTCTVVGEVGQGEIALAPQLGHDGGFVFGRVGSDATTVEVEVPRTGTISAPVVADRFFLARLTPAMERPLTNLNVKVSAIARNSAGETVARSNGRLEQSVAPVDVPTNTGPAAAPNAP
jgi:hypothetical protein